MWNIPYLHADSIFYMSDKSGNGPLHHAMISFYKDPTQEIFNNIVLAVGDLYEADEPDDEDMYVQYVGETEERARIRKWKQRIDKLDESDAKTIKIKTLGLNPKLPAIKYSDPVLLAWIWAAAKKYPWLAENCDRPLIIERAIMFYRGSHLKLKNKLEDGPEYYDHVNAKRAKFSVGAWQRGLCHYLDQTAMMFGATGDHVHLQTMVDITLKHATTNYNRDPDLPACRGQFTKGHKRLELYTDAIPELCDYYDCAEHRRELIDLGIINK